MSKTPSSSSPSPAAKLTSALDDLPVDARAPLALFAAHLADVRFPDVDVDALAALVGELRTRTEAAARARSALDQATAAEAAARGMLRDTLARGVAYARIYAAAHPERAELASVLAELGAASSPGAAPSGADGLRKRRGRPPKVRGDAAVGELLATGPVSAGARGGDTHGGDAEAPESARYATAGAAASA